MIKRLVQMSLLFVVAFATAGCSFSFQKWQYKSALRDLESKRYTKAVQQFSRVIRRSPESPVALEAARKASRVATFDLKDYQAAVEFLRHLVFYSPDSQERLAAQKSLGDLYFEKLMDYDQAVVEYSRLIRLISAEERLPYRLRISRAYYNLNNFNQALIELDDLLEQKLPADLRFDALLFKGNLLQAAKKLDRAIGAFTELMKKYPERAERESVAINLAVCYEEMGDFHGAISVLDELKRHYPNPEFIEIRINRLKDRMANQPGAQGIKR